MPFKTSALFIEQKMAPDTYENLKVKHNNLCCHKNLL